MTTWQDVTVVRIDNLAIGIKLVVFRSSDGTPLLPPPPGAHLDIQLAPGLIRQYSLCGDPAVDPDSYAVAVKLEPSSRGGSSAVHALRKGVRVRVGVVRDRFPIDSTATKHRLIAGGIGITPIMSIARHLARTGSAWQLDYFGRDLAGMAFVAELDGPHYRHRTRMHPGVPIGDVPIRLAAALGFAAQKEVLYVCGPTPMMSTTAKVAAQLGWPSENVRMESFQAAEAKVGLLDGKPDRDRAFTLVLQKSGVEVVVNAEETALAALRRANVVADSSCETGICGTCLTKVLDGAIDHRDSYLTDEERSEGVDFLPCVSRALGERLVVDR